MHKKLQKVTIQIYGDLEHLFKVTKTKEFLFSSVCAFLWFCIAGGITAVMPYVFIIL